MAGRVRQPIDEAAFQKYVSENVPEIKTPIDLKQFGFGQSNPTYQITAADGQRFVMRKKPPGKLISKTAHKVEREHRIMHALEKTDVAVPKMYCLCEDDSIIGTPFYIMEFLDGRIFEDFTMPDVSVAEREAMWRDAVKTLARFHAVDYKKVGLERFGKPSGFYNRQVDTWFTICGKQEQAVDVETKEPVGKLPYFDETVRFFKNERLQPKDRATLVHGDYKIDNLVFHKTEPRVIGILDWEMSTVGHPLSDVCNLLTNFYTARFPNTVPFDASGFLPGRTQGLPQPDQIMEWYTETSGYDPRAEVAWGIAFSIWKLAGVCQGIAARYAQRQASSEKAKQHAVRRGPMAELAWELAKEAGAEEASSKLRIRLSTPPPPSHDRDDERQPLLRTLTSIAGPSSENTEAFYSCMTNPHSHLPVYTNIHRIRRDIISVVEDHLSLEQLQDLKINVTVVRPLVDKFYGLNDISIIYCLLVNRAQFLEEQSHSNSRHNVNYTRATLCELIATRILRRFGEAHDGPDGLLLLAHILVAGFEPFQNAPDEIRQEAERTTSWMHHKTLPSLEIAIVTDSKLFLSSTTCQKVVDAIYEGRIVYTPSTFWDIIPDHYKLKPIAIYDPRDSPLLNQYRLIVPRTRNILESLQFAILLALYFSVMAYRSKEHWGPLEILFDIFAFGWALDQFATLLAHGWSVYTQNLWSFLDVTFILIYWIYLCLRLYGKHAHSIGLAEQAYDVLALAAPVLVPRLAFNLLRDNLIFLSLRSMMADFFFLTALSAWCFLGFMLSLLWLGEGAHPLVTVAKWMIYIWFGLDGTGIQRSTEFHWLLGPTVMVAFAFLGNTLFLTILVSMLSNTFSTISSNATAEIMFRRAVLTLEGVKADAVFAYQPPFNIVAVFLFVPLKFVVSPRWFHKIHVAAVKFLNLPLLLVIAVAERRILWPPSSPYDSSDKRATPTKSRFWKKWRLTVHRDLQAVFQVPPPETVQDDIAVDDDLTHHLIRRQFTGRVNQTSEPQQARRPSRRDSMFPGIPQKLRGSFAEPEDLDNLTTRIETMERSMRRIEAMLSQLVPSVEDAIVDDMDESGTLQGGPTTQHSSLTNMAD
ncbi:kinase-like domain-containing protein [Mariannaea sp. PMI_226]|nr:kinase-like domain-containing protein [Mariannaea sp. PMI_226]